MHYWPVKIVVENVDGSCPYYRKGDTFYVERSAIILDESTAETGICLHASTRLTPELAMMTRGLMAGEKVVACGDLPGHFGGGGARVLFRIIPGKRKEVIYTTKADWEKARKKGTLQWKDKEFTPQSEK